MTYLEYELAFDELVDKATNDMGQVPFALFIRYIYDRARAMMEESDGA